MVPELRIIMEALADCVFATADPTPEELEKLNRTLPDGYVGLVSLFLNLRLVLRWQGFGVKHTSIEVGEPTPNGAVPVSIRVFDPSSTREPIRHALEHSGFFSINWRDGRTAMGGWLTATATAPLVQRLRG